jgi:hypothetical protein
MKPVLCHLPHNTTAEDISDGLVRLGFDVIRVKHMTDTCRSPSDGSTTINVPLFLITCRGRQNPRKCCDCKASATSQSGWRHIGLRIVLRSAITASSSDTPGTTANSPPLLVVRRGSSAQGVPREREYIFHPNVLQLSIGGRRETQFRKLSGLQTREGGDADEEVAEDT